MTRLLQKICNSLERFKRNKLGYRFCLFGGLKMAVSYHIVGTLHVYGEGNAVKFKLQPDPKYLSPDKKYAVFYRNTKEDPFVKLLIDGVVNVSVTEESENLAQQALIQIAVKRQAIELVVDKSLQITGFKFPV